MRVALLKRLAESNSRLDVRRVSSSSSREKPQVVNARGGHVVAESPARAWVEGAAHRTTSSYGGRIIALPLSPPGTVDQIS